MLHALSRTLIMMAACAWSAVFAPAQQPTGAITGRVADAAGALQGVQVTIASGVFSRDTFTEASGPLSL